MSEKIVLTKIGKDLSKYHRNNGDKITTFQYQGKEWVWLDAFKEDANNILHLITGETKKLHDFTIDQSEDGVYVNVVYRQHIRSNRHEIYDQILDLIFSNFQKSHIESSTQETKILKTYVTTTLYEALQKRHISAETVTQQKLSKLTLPAKFLPTLCEYQKKSVLWLLMREREPYEFPAFFQKLQSKDDETVVYKHLYSRYIQTEPPPDICLPPGGILADEMGLGKTVEMLSLILLHPRTDETQYEVLLEFLEMNMAKRKKVETNVFCICTSTTKKNIIQCNKCLRWQHKRCVGHDKDYEDDVHRPYLCPCCWQIVIDNCGLLKTKATFIVSPNTIQLQWLSEIKRHINPSLRVFLYDGIRTGKWVSPWELSEYDVVLTNYNVLRGEIYFTQNNVSERTTRNQPRSMRMNTPILMLDWWRVLLDEAQMVESNASNLAALVHMIPAINRWAVTGTPIQKSLNDLQPLLQFIGFDAASDKDTWNYLVNDFVLQQERNNSDNGDDNITVPELINILQKCMWRTCKTQISTELKIPPQQEIVHRIEFDNFEKIFYNEQHSECRSNFMVNVNKYTKRMKTISPQIMTLILQPFLKIRQTCTIPLVINSSNNNNKHVNAQQQKQFLQPKELHSYLKSSNELSCKSELRSMASSNNGLAGLYFLEKDYDQAIKHYEAVLKLANDYNHMNVTVDSLLQIHALHNMMHIKNIQNNTESNDSFSETYKSQYNALEWKYLGTYASTLATVKLSYESALNKIDAEIEDNFLTSMANGLEILLANDESLLMQKIHEECLLRFGQTNVKLSEIRSTRSLMYIVQMWFHKLTANLKVVHSEITALKFFIENVRSRNQVSPAVWRDVMHLVNTVYDCHLSEIREVQQPNKKSKTSEKKKQMCKMCCLRDSMNKFECLLFDKVIDKNTNYTDGLENPSFEMFLCKIILKFIKNKHRESSEVMDKSWSYLENLQLVCKRLIKLWIEMEYTIKAYDELDMCKMRITLTEDPEDKSIFKILKQDIVGNILDLQTQLMNAQTQFAVKLARLRYIKHLEGDDDLDACPICRLTDDVRYAVLECGHHICFPCLKSIRQYAKGFKFKCSVCRHVQQTQNLYYVSRTKFKTSNDEKIKGDYSSKITYIVRLILKLMNEDRNNSKNQNATDMEAQENDSSSSSDIKILIFSQWEPILLAIALALKENDIKFRAQCTAKTIAEFKNPILGITCLLMPFIRGSKGLNLVEATHVFLVEPILNPGEELQAIGRVHRFGQTKTTTVHRFIVSDSIEENIYNFIDSSLSNSNEIQSRWDFDNISLQDFENLFSLQEKNEC